MLDFFKGDKNDKQTKATDRSGYMNASLPMWERVGYGIQRSKNYATLMQHFNGWVYAAAMCNARTISAQTLRLYSRRPQNGAKSLAPTRAVGTTKTAYLQGKMENKPSIFVQRKAIQGDIIEVTDHPVLELLDNPSPEMDGYTLTMLRMLNLQLTGNSYLHPIMSETINVPIELWSMPSHLVKIIPDGEFDMVASYEYGQLPNVTTFRKDEVLHERQPNPSDMLYGRGWVEAAHDAINLLESMDEYEQNVLDNQARPDWAVMVKEHLTDTQYQRLYQQIEKRLGGKNNRSRPFIFEGGIDGKSMQFSPNDLQFATGENRKVEVIAAISGVPVSMLKANDPNLASAREGSMGHLRNTIIPYLSLDEGFLNRQLLPMFGIFADALFLAYDDPIQEDKLQDSQINASDIAAGIRTRNEVRESLGLEYVEGGDVLFVPAGSVPIDVAIDMARNPQPMYGMFSAEETIPKATAPPPTSVQHPKIPASGDGDGVSRDDSAPAPKPEDGKCPDGWHLMEADEKHDKPWCMHGNTHPISADSMSKASDCVSEKIPKLLEEGYDQDQAAAIAYSMCNDQKSNDKECGCEGKKKIVSAKTLWEEAMSMVGTKRAPVDTGNDDFERRMSDYSRWIDQLRDGIAGIFRTEIERFLDTGMGVEGFLQGDSNQELREAATEFVAGVTAQAGQLEFDDLGIGFEFNPLNASVANYLEMQTDSLVRTLTEGTRKEVADKIKLGIRHGASTDEIAMDIRDLLKKEPESGRIPIEARAEMIARTEVAMVIEGARLEAWVQSGVIEKKQWQISAGACESCRAMAVLNPDPIPLLQAFAGFDTTVGKISVWTPNGEGLQHAPLHPNCRCGTIQILSDETKEEIEFRKEQAEQAARA